MEFAKTDIISFYDNLSAVLTEWETGEISDFELYDFMVDLHTRIAALLN